MAHNGLNNYKNYNINDWSAHILTALTQTNNQYDGGDFSMKKMLFVCLILLAQSVLCEEQKLLTIYHDSDY